MRHGHDPFLSIQLVAFIRGPLSLASKYSSSFFFLSFLKRIYFLLMKNRIGPPKPLPTKQPGGFGLDVRGPGGPTRGPQRERPGQGAPGPGPRLQPLEDAAGSQPPGGPDFFLFGARQGGLGSFFFLFFFFFFVSLFGGKGGGLGVLKKSENWGCGVTLGQFPGGKMRWGQWIRVLGAALSFLRGALVLFAWGFAGQAHYEHHCIAGQPRQAPCHELSHAGMRAREMSRIPRIFRAMLIPNGQNGHQSCTRPTVVCYFALLMPQVHLQSAQKCRRHEHGHSVMAVA